MALRWYLMKSPYDTLSGFETESVEDFAEDGFAEALESSIGYDVDLYTNDMSEYTSIRAIIQKNVADTRLNALHRHIFTKIGTCKAGMYVKYNERFWIITGIVDNNGIYEKGVMTICNNLLTWLNDDGNIIQRWASITSASQYNNGLSYHKNFDLRTDQLLAELPNDTECIMITNGKRFVVDKRIEIYEKKIDNDVTMDTTLDLITYEVTRVNNTLYDYGDSGTIVVLLTQDEQHKGDGYYRINDVGYWLCDGNTDVINSDGETTDSSTAIIEYDSDEIYVGYKAEQFTAVFRDENGNIESVDPSWIIDCDFEDLLNIDYVDNTIIISTDDMSLLNKSFELSLGNSGYESPILEVKICSI